MFARNRPFILIISALASIFIGKSASLGALKYPAEIGPAIGYLLIEGDSNVDSSFLYGARFGSYLSPSDVLELSVLGGRSEIKQSSRHVDILLPTVELQHFLNNGPWKHYFAFGLGFLQTNRDRRVDENKIDFSVPYGFGVRHALTQHFLFRLDARHLINTESGKGTHNGLLTVGISWIYGSGVQPDPEPVKVLDSDNDGVTDDQDLCPQTSTGTQVDSKGCPLDSDEDGVLDETDACPDTPAHVVVDTNGCPVPLDTDGDGIIDDKDECPDTPVGTAIDSFGCPKTVKSIPDKEWVLKGVHFESGSDKLTADSIRGLEEAVEILSTRLGVRVEIQGNTDRTGSEELNMKLSLARAEAVKTYLIGRGIEASRMQTRGLGFTNPVASNKTPQGRAQNRRIEFKVLSR